MPSLRFSVLLACMLGMKSVCGQVSLYVPGFDPQPLSVNELGAGSDGRTTWEILPGQPTGTFEQADFVGTATLVEGPNDAVISYNIPAITLSVAENCNIANGIAVCSVDVGGTTDVETETATPFLVQGGTTAIASSPSAVLTPTAAPSSGSTPLISPSQTSSGSAPTQTANGGPKQASSFAAAILGAAGIVLAMS